jgi:hypothetical protein
MSGVGDAPDEHTDDPPESAAERVIRHRMRGHEAALEIAGQVDRPDLLAEQVEETEHRLAEDADILDEIRRNEQGEG